MKDDLSIKRLKEDIIYSITKFQMYAALSPLERNINVASTLAEILREAEKWQIERSILDGDFNNEE